MNRTIHQDLIGGADSTGEFCLYKAYRNAKKAIQTFKAELQVDPLPGWYWILNVVATLLIAVSLFEVFRWLNLWHIVARALQ